MFLRLAAPVAVAALVVATPALAHHEMSAVAGVQTKAAAPFEVTNGWVREAPPGAEVLAAYFSVKNTGKSTVILKGVTSPLFGRVEMHQVKEEDGRVKMSEVKSITLKAGETLTLAPGGAHLMMFEPVRALKAAEQVPFTLDFGQAGKANVKFTVQRKAPGGHDHDHGHDGHEHHH